MINVVAAIIKQDDLIYICKRSESMSLPNLWEFPGGYQGRIWRIK